MTEILTYAIATVILSGGFYALFRTFLQGERAFALNRRILIGFALLSLALPALSFTDIFKLERTSLPAPRVNIAKIFANKVDNALMPRTAQASNNTVSREPTRARFLFLEKKELPAPESEFNYKWFALLLYVIIFLVLAGKTIKSAIGIISIKKRGKLSRFPGYTVCLLNDNIAPFSWWKTIFIPNGTYDERELEQIILHERAHIDQRHSLDLIFFELVCALWWFNPFLRLLKRSAIELHEYLADSATLSAGINRADYSATLYKNLTGMKLFATSHYLNKDQVKRRLRMMSKAANRKLSTMKYALVIQCAAILGFAFTCTEAGRNAMNYKDAEGMHVFLTTDTEYKITKGDKAPEFPGGGRALEDYLLKDSLIQAIAYMKDNSLEMEVEFFVDKKGWAQYPKSFSYVMDEERYAGYHWDLGMTIAKLIKDFPRFEPAQRNGENVSSIMKLLINFSQLNAHPHYFGNREIHPDKPPQFQGSYADFQNYLRKNLRFPEEAKKRGISGKFNVSFYVEPDGSITEPEITSYKLTDDGWGYGETYGCDKEALRLASAMPHWKPGMKNGKPVRCIAIIPVMFGDEYKWYSKSDPEVTIYAKAPNIQIEYEKEVNDYMANNDIDKFKPYWGGNYFSKLLQKRIKYPDSQRSNGAPVDFYSSFIVNSQGEIRDIHIEGHPPKDFENEALRAIKSFGPVKPVISKTGEPVEYFVILSVKFRV